jgi:flagellar hook-basal body complex protein FliE
MNDVRIGLELTTPKLALPSGAEAEAKTSFGDIVSNLIKTADTATKEGMQKGQELAAGDAGMVETILALNKADIELRYAVELRNRALEAYKSIIRISV